MKQQTISEGKGIKICNHNWIPAIDKAGINFYECTKCECITDGAVTIDRSKKRLNESDKKFKPLILNPTKITNTDCPICGSGGGDVCGNCTRVIETWCEYNNVKPLSKTKQQTISESNWEKEFDDIFGDKHHLICEGKKCTCKKEVKDFIRQEKQKSFKEGELSGIRKAKVFQENFNKRQKLQSLLKQ